MAMTRITISQIVWVKRAVRAHRLIGKERQDDKSRTGKDQSVFDFVFCEDPANKAMERRPGGEHNRHRGCEAGSERRLAH